MLAGILTFLKGLGMSLVAEAVPVVGKALIDGINEVSDEKLDVEKATGVETAKAIENLPAAAQAQLLQNNLILSLAEISANRSETNNWYELQKVLLESERAGAKVRPLTVGVMVVLVFIGVLCGLGSQLYIVYQIAEWADKNPAMLASIGMITAAMPSPETWAAILLFPCWVIRSFFGDRSDDKRVRATAISGQPIEPKKSLGSTIGTAVAGKILKKK